MASGSRTGSPSSNPSVSVQESADGGPVAPACWPSAVSRAVSSARALRGGPSTIVLRGTAGPRVEGVAPLILGAASGSKGGAPSPMVHRLGADGIGSVGTPPGLSSRSGELGSATSHLPYARLHWRWIPPDVK